MAKSVDNYNDLEELGIDEIDDISEKFTKAANHLPTLVSNVDNTTLALLYGYYKQATEGPCKTSKPRWFDMKAKYKWEAWNKLENMPQTDAKLLYIETIQKLDPEFSPTSKKESWVTVSTLQSQDEFTGNIKKSVVDYVKENFCSEVFQLLKTCDQKELSDMLSMLDSEGLALIHWAADRGYVEMLQLLISFGSDIDLPDSEKQTPLHYASSCGHVNCVKLLVENGANVNAVDADGETPFTVSSDNSVQEALIAFK